MERQGVEKVWVVGFDKRSSGEKGSRAEAENLEIKRR